MEPAKDPIRFVNGVALHSADFDFIGYSRRGDELKLLMKNHENAKFYTIKFGKHSVQKHGLMSAFADATPGSFRFDESAKPGVSVKLLTDQYGCPHLDSQAMASGIGAIFNAAFFYTQRGTGKYLDGSFGLTEDKEKI